MMQNPQLKQQTQDCEYQQKVLVKLVRVLLLFTCIVCLALVLMMWQPEMAKQSSAERRGEIEQNSHSLHATIDNIKTKASKDLTLRLQKLRLHNITRNLASVNTKSISGKDSNRTEAINIKTDNIDNSITTMQTTSAIKTQVKQWEVEFLNP